MRVQCSRKLRPLTVPVDRASALLLRCAPVKLRTFGLTWLAIALVGTVSRAEAPALVLRDFVGLLSLSGLVPEGDFERPVLSEPADTATVVALIRNDGIEDAAAKTRCQWFKTCPVRELDEEVPGLIALERRGDWARVPVSSDGATSGWVKLERGDQVERYPELLRERLTFATPEWDGTVADEPGGEGRKAKRAKKQKEQSVNVLGFREVDGAQWIEVELLSEHCGPKEAAVLDHGWVKARGEGGIPTVWYRPRGC